MPRRVYLLGVGLALVALGLAVTDWALSLRPGVTEANVRRVKPGMTVREVEQIFGGPAGWVFPLDFGKLPPALHAPYPVRWVGHWFCDNGEAVVHFDERDRVEKAEFRQGSWFLGRKPQRPSLPVRFRAWLGW
jgi:hypothetical protein